MKLRPFLADTIAARFAMAVLATAGATLLLIGLFVAFGGVWAKRPLDADALSREAVAIARMIAATPPPQRQTLATAAASRDIRIHWYGPASRAAAVLQAARRHRSDLELDEIGRETGALSVAAGPGEDIAAVAPTPELSRRSEAEYLAVQLDDQSWLVFIAVRRTWGLTMAARMALWLVFLALSAPVVSVLAARRLSRPVGRLAEAARLFGENPAAPPLAKTGPIELRQMIATFNSMQARIQRFVSERTLMLAAISHDLRTPLTRIRLRGEFIEDLAQQQRLFRDVDEMQAMIDGALAYFRDDAKAEQMTTFDLAGLFATLQDDFADQGVEIAYTGPSRLAYRGRPFALKRALSNLIENAVRHATPPTIALSVTPTQAVIEVCDRGPGIPSEARDRVFAPYYRLDKSRSRATGGIGLGLTVAQGVVREHGGDLVLSETAGGGLTAHIVLPLRDQP